MANPLILNIIIIVIIVAIVNLLCFGFKKYIFKLVNNKNDNPWIIKDTKNAKNSMIITQDPKDENSITLYRSDGLNGELQFSYSFWMCIENMEYNFGKWKHVFHKGNKTTFPNRAPGVFIHKDTNALRFYMNTYKNMLEYVDIDNIPIRRWFHVALVLEGQHLDIYFNGYLKKRHKLTSMAKQNFGDLYLNMYGGYEGYLSRLRYYRHALNYREIESIVNEGPSKDSCSGTDEKPPYLNDDWWSQK